MYVVYQPSSNTPGVNETIYTQGANTSLTNQSGEAREIVVVGKNMSFSPSSITVKKGERVRITFQNIEGTHDFKLDEFRVGTRRIKAGQRESVEFIADKVGIFEFYCSVIGHRFLGMKGILVVEE